MTVYGHECIVLYRVDLVLVLKDDNFEELGSMTFRVFASIASQHLQNRTDNKKV